MNQHGISAASVPLKHWGVPCGVAWRDLPANYPVIGLMFFRAVAGIIPTVTFGKLVLTGIEALNALFVARVARSRAIGFLYWASPLSIFCVPGAGFSFALAIQAKVTSKDANS